MCDKRPAKTVADSRTETVHIIFERSLNHQGTLYGGELFGWIDEAAGIAAIRHSGKTVVTASIEHMDFKAAAGIGDLIYICARLTYAGNTSMEVRVDCYVENITDGTRRPINTALFVMIAMDGNGKPAQVPSLRVETPDEKAEWEAARKRQEQRKEERARQKRAESFI